jgi:hypothetical protein
MTERRRVHYPIKHVSVFVLKWDDGSFAVKCGDLKLVVIPAHTLRIPTIKAHLVGLQNINLNNFL